jgi:CTP:molybdopterin cytidylyltransferase MocA
VTTYDAILPAGGTIPEEYAAKVGTNKKPLVEIQGRTVLAITIAALRESGLVRRIVVIGSDEVLAHPDAKKADISIEEGVSGPDNIYLGLQALLESGNPPDRVLISTTDLPFVSAEVVRRFVESCPSKDFCVPLISEQEYAERFPGTHATCITLRDRVCTAGCMYMATVSGLKGARPYIEKVFEQRKSKIGMAKLLGPMFLIKFVLKRLTLADVENKITGLLRCTGAAVAGSPPELVFDIDYLDDYEYAIANAERIAALR